MATNRGDAHGLAGRMRRHVRKHSKQVQDGKPLNETAKPTMSINQNPTGTIQMNTMHHNHNPQHSQMAAPTPAMPAMYNPYVNATPHQVPVPVPAPHAMVGYQTFRSPYEVHMNAQFVPPPSSYMGHSYGQTQQQQQQQQQQQHLTNANYWGKTVQEPQENHRMPPPFPPEHSLVPVPAPAMQQQQQQQQRFAMMVAPVPPKHFPPSFAPLPAHAPMPGPHPVKPQFTAPYKQGRQRYAVAASLTAVPPSTAAPARNLPKTKTPICIAPPKPSLQSAAREIPQQTPASPSMSGKSNTSSFQHPESPRKEAPNQDDDPSNSKKRKSLPSSPIGSWSPVDYYVEPTLYNHTAVTPKDIEKAIPKDASSFFHIIDRRINLDAFEEDASLYSLLRAWVQDDPYRYTPPVGSNLLEYVSLPSSRRRVEEDERSSNGHNSPVEQQEESMHSSEAQAEIAQEREKGEQPECQDVLEQMRRTATGASLKYASRSVALLAAHFIVPTKRKRQRARKYKLQREAAKKRLRSIGIDIKT